MSFEQQRYCIHPIDERKTPIFECRDKAREHIIKHFLTFPEAAGWSRLFSLLNFPEAKEYCQNLAEVHHHHSLITAVNDNRDAEFCYMYSLMVSVVRSSLDSAKKYNFLGRNEKATVSYSLFGVLCVIDEQSKFAGPLLKTLFLPGLGKQEQCPTSTESSDEWEGDTRSFPKDSSDNPYNRSKEKFSYNDEEDFDTGRRNCTRKNNDEAPQYSTYKLKRRKQKRNIEPDNLVDNPEVETRPPEQVLYEEVIHKGITFLRNQYIYDSKQPNGRDYALVRDQVDPISTYLQWLPLYLQDYGTACAGE